MGCMLNPVHLILGDEEFLAERATSEIVDAAGPGAEVTRIRGSEVTGSAMAAAGSPSLFAEDRVIVVEHTELAGKDAVEALLRACVDPAPGVTLVIEHTGGGKQKSQVPKFEKAAEVHCASLPANQRQSWVTAEFRRHGVRPTPDVVSAVLESVGSDLRELAAAVSQLVSDTEGEITVAAVREYYNGVAEVAGFDIADQAVLGRGDRALASARRALQLGTKPAAIAAALAYKVGDLAKLYGVRGNPNQLAGELGLHPFVAKKTMQVARRWSGEAITEAVIIVADLDAAVKGQGGDDEFAVEDAVRRIAGLV